MQDFALSRYKIREDDRFAPGGDKVSLKRDRRAPCWPGFQTINIFVGHEMFIGNPGFLLSLSHVDLWPVCIHTRIYCRPASCLPAPGRHCAEAPAPSTDCSLKLCFSRQPFSGACDEPLNTPHIVHPGEGDHHSAKGAVTPAVDTPQPRLASPHR